MGSSSKDDRVETAFALDAAGASVVGPACCAMASLVAAAAILAAATALATAAAACRLSMSALTAMTVWAALAAAFKSTPLRAFLGATRTALGGAASGSAAQGLRLGGKPEGLGRPADLPLAGELEVVDRLGAPAEDGETEWRPILAGPVTSGDRPRGPLPSRSGGTVGTGDAGRGMPGVVAGEAWELDDALGTASAPCCPAAT